MDQTPTAAVLDELAPDEMRDRSGGFTDPLTALIRLLRPGFSEPILEPILSE